MGTLQVAELNDFTGGMNTVQAPYKIARNESTLMANVDIKKGGLVSAPRILKYQDLSYRYWFQFIGTVYQYQTLRSNVIWNNVWYWADGSNTGKKYPDEFDSDLGLATPTSVLDLTENTSEPGNITGNVRYCYTFYDTQHGVESAPSPMSAYLRVEQSSIDITNFEDLPQNADVYRLYRIGGYLPYFQLVAEVTKKTYTDTLDEHEIDGRKLNTIRNGPPPSGINFFTELGGRMYGATSNRLYYSAIGNPDSWYIYDYILFQGTILGLAKVPAGLLVMGDRWVYLLQGDQPQNFKLKQISDKVGCKGHHSIAYIDNYAIWLSNHGLVRSDGFSLDFITKDKIENVQNVDPMGATALNHIYYLAYGPSLFPSNTLFPKDELYPQGVKGTGAIDQGIIICDFKRGRGFSYQIRDLQTVQYLGQADGEICVTWGKSEHHAFDCDEVAYEDCLGFQICSGYEMAYLNKRQRLVDTYFTPRENLFPRNRLFPTNLINVDMEYVATSDDVFYTSPILIDGSYATLKEYDKVRVIYRGIFTITVMFDNDRVVREKTLVSLNDENNEYALIGIPNSDNKAYSIRFAVQGVGIIHSIQYTFKYRELP